MVTETILEAQVHLSELVAKAQAGETVVLTNEAGGSPLVRLEPVVEKKPRRLGFMETPGFELGPAFFEPMTDEECGHAGDDLTV